MRTMIEILMWCEVIAFFGLFVLTMAFILSALSDVWKQWRRGRKG